MGFGIPTAERAALEATYEDTAVISRMGTKQVGAIDIPIPRQRSPSLACWRAMRSTAMMR